jgi:hypothetical protein
MSTTFGIRGPVLGNTVVHTVDVARRIGVGKGKVSVYWLSQDVELLCSLIDDNTPVDALDNSSQGISTLGDLKRAIAESS